MSDSKYGTFPMRPKKDGNIVAVFWTILNDYRKLQDSEKRNVVYPAKKAGLIVRAPNDEHGIQVNEKGERSGCGFILTALGHEYYQAVIASLVTEGYTSEQPLPQSRTAGSDEDLFAWKKRSWKHQYRKTKEVANA